MQFFEKIWTQTHNNKKNRILYRGTSRNSCCMCRPVSCELSKIFVFFCLLLLLRGWRSDMTVGLRNMWAKTLLPIKCVVIFLKRSFFVLSILLDFEAVFPAFPWFVLFVNGPALIIFSSSFCRSLMLRFGTCCIIFKAIVGCRGRTIS